MDERIKKIINKLVIAGATPGVNYAVIKNKDKYIGSLGLRGKYILNNKNLIELPEKNDINTVYDLASLTKVICTLTLIFKLIESRKIDMDDEVKKYLDLPLNDSVTIYNLLTHTSGIYTDINKEIISRDYVMNRLYQSYIKTSKGEFKYTDIGYMLLGLIIEKLYDKSLDEVFDLKVAQPLEMRNTGFNPKNNEIIAPTEVTQKRGVVRGIVHDEKACALNGVAGHAGLFSNIEDLVNFSSMILNNGMFRDYKYFDKSVIEKWFTPLISDRIYKRSFSWFVGDNPNIIEGEDAISFHGFTGPSLSIDRVKNVIIIMLTNRVHPTRDNKLNTNMRPNITKELYDIIFSDIEENHKVYLKK